MRSARWSAAATFIAMCTSSAELFELEMERLWHSAWVYVGHDSQVPAAGDYYTTEIAAPARPHDARAGRRGAGALQPLRASGRETRERDCGQLRRDSALSLPRLDLSAGWHAAHRAAQGRLRRHAASPNHPRLSDSRRSAASPSIAASCSPGSAAAGPNSRHISATRSRRSTTWPTARRWAASKWSAARCATCTTAIGRCSSRISTTPCIPWWRTSPLPERHATCGRISRPMRQSPWSSSSSCRSCRTTSSSTTWASRSTTTATATPGVNFSIHSKYSRHAGVRGANGRGIRRGARARHPGRDPPQHRLLPQSHGQGSHSDHPRCAADGRRPYAHRELHAAAGRRARIAAGAQRDVQHGSSMRRPRSSVTTICIAIGRSRRA